jgi:hypothetical protein
MGSLTRLRGRVPLFAADNITDRRRLSEATRRCRRARCVVIDENHHPNADGAGVAEQRGAMNPARPAFAFTVLVRTAEPTDLSSDTTAFCEGGAKV